VGDLTVLWSILDGLSWSLITIWSLKKMHTHNKVIFKTPRLSFLPISVKHCNLSACVFLGLGYTLVSLRWWRNSAPRQWALGKEPAK
jgi:hypothetical protein